ncbi:MAG: deoxyribose-phosphate aldolase [SAR324 cluster bacterium]|uniref:Deoxyribose-phosphate aldolase n=1 Tax=SAR324 cluster bacterium TaxID=2024889 RepID=A0A2A4SS96_9DELT|nr:MAG: deoxyribose-phosphate aldolase [SAR324 cluster bacterium]
MKSKEVALRALQLIDLTSLGDNDSEETIKQLCIDAITEFGSTAAICVWPRFVPHVHNFLGENQIPVAAVTNFPQGKADLKIALAETKAAVAYGADEVDLVFPYQTWLAGNQQLAGDMVAACKEICRDITLKVILETGELGSVENIAGASMDAIRHGADFIKTSTGKSKVSATPEAAKAMLTAILESGKSVGFKASGGIRTTEDAAIYLALADEIMGENWVSPQTFRFGASGLLKDLIAVIQSQERQANTSSY